MAGSINRRGLDLTSFVLELRGMCVVLGYPHGVDYQGKQLPEQDGDDAEPHAAWEVTAVFLTGSPERTSLAVTPLGAPGGGHAGAAGGRRRARAPMVAGGGHRHGGAVAERGEGKEEMKQRSTAHPGSTATTETATGPEEGGGAARVDRVDGAPAVGDRNGEVDEVGEDAAKPKEAAPRWEVVRGDGGGGPELGGHGGERE
uniref:Transposon protein, putative, CACTA, En/Spm sub-class n=1 Tax=Oryza sativa subsp. japonica TaxID=39947 RepID=Q60DB5_ORYSJ|nr:transposon protein, putative, CACTA, En/Spm sub-class [Oryza sativa Japonica Group]AAU89165.1 transposon protein, putative, CACTA, En/Spm sub-class [Oryza sativa Japonica Group]